MHAFRRISALSAFLIIGLLILPASAQEAPVIDVVPVGVCAVNIPDGCENLSIFGQSAGTHVALMLRRPQGGLIGIDEEKYSIAKFQDDTGAGLFKETTLSKAFFSEDDAHTRLVVEIHSESIPSAGAKSVTVEGEVTAKIADGTDTFATAQPVELKAGAEFTAGTFKMKISEFQPADQYMTIETSAGGASVVRLRFKDADGKELPIEQHSSSWSGEDYASWSFGFETAPTACVIEVECWKNVKTVKVPFAVTMSLGW